MTRPIALVTLTLVVLARPVVAQAPAAGGATPQAAKAPVGPRIPKIHLDRVWPSLKLVRPVQMIQSPLDEKLWYIVEQPGRIRLANIEDRALVEAPLVIDLTEQVNDRGNEEGLLSIAFHPGFLKKRELYVFYTTGAPARDRLSRFTVSADGTSIDPKSEEVLLDVPDPYSNHNCGTVLFGPDGMLYLSIGDGGGANDPKKSGQDLDTLLAKVLRIDVDKADQGLKYSIPKDNPFVNREGARPEIWAYGLRNVWRMHFDRKTGDLWAGDVGQNLWEEIDIIKKGGNYGWNMREGFHDFAGKSKEGFIEPVVEYSHREGVSVTGGFVYRGEHKAMDGVYIYADFAFGTYWGIRMVDGAATEPTVLLVKRGSLPSSFAEAKDGALYVLTFEGGQGAGQAGAVWKIVPED